MGKLNFTGWKFKAEFRRKKVSDGLRSVGKETTARIRRGMIKGPHTGRIYKLKGGKRHRASVNRKRQEYPAKRTGKLVRTLRYILEPRRVSIGTSMPYSKWLRDGRQRMKSRRMSNTALRQGAKYAAAYFRGWAGWKKR